jgi:uncharacterized protein
MPRLDAIMQIRAELLDLARRRNATGLAVFGSVARNAERSDSDVDFLVTCGPGMSLFDLQALHDDLAERLRSRVDVVSIRSLKSPVRELILGESVQL